MALFIKALVWIVSDNNLSPLFCPGQESSCEVWRGGGPAAQGGGGAEGQDSQHGEDDEVSQRVFEKIKNGQEKNFFKYRLNFM